MKLMDIYYHATNPIEDDLKFNKILDAYSNPNGLYAGLSTASSRDYSNADSFGKLKANHNLKDKDVFYSKITNLWIKSIKDMSREFFNERIGTRSFFDLRHKYILKCDNVNSKEESDELLSGNNLDNSLKDALDLYKWTYDSNYWEHVKAGSVHLDRDKFVKCDHRLYVNPDGEDLYLFMNYFVDKCEERNLSYYFKFCKYFSRDDNFVLYSSTKELDKYLEVLREIKLEHPDLVSRFKEPPLLTGNIDGFIGYGSEPVELNKDKIEYSFNSLRENKVLTPAIEKVTREWLRDNRNREISFRDKEITIKNLISYMAVDDICDTLKHYVKDKDLRTAVNEDGICMYDLNDTNVLNSMFNIIDKRIDSNIDKYLDYSNDCDSITIPLRGGKKFYFSSYQFERVINNLPKKIANVDKEYVGNLKNEINKNAANYKINVNKFFLDNYALKQLQLADYNNLKEKSNNKEWIDKKNNDLNKMFATTNIVNIENKKQNSN